MGEWDLTGEPFFTPDNKFDTQAYLRYINRRMELREIERQALATAPEDR